MRIGLEMMTDTKAVAKEMEKAINDAILEKLIEVGERAITIVRLKIKTDGGYDNWTGNLRSSTGFIIYKDGKVVNKNFEASPVGTDKATGLRVGLEKALDTLRESKGWGIVMVSGMEYASWVESKGYDVLKGARIGLEEALQQAFNEIGGIE